MSLLHILCSIHKGRERQSLDIDPPCPKNKPVRFQLEHKDMRETTCLDLNRKLSSLSDVTLRLLSQAAALLGQPPKTKISYFSDSLYLDKIIDVREESLVYFVGYFGKIPGSSLMRWRGSI